MDDMDMIASMLADLGLERREIVSAPLDGRDVNPHRTAMQRPPVVADQRAAAWRSQDNFSRDAISEQLPNYSDGQGHRARMEADMQRKGLAGKEYNYRSTRETRLDHVAGGEERQLWLAEQQKLQHTPEQQRAPRTLPSSNNNGAIKIQDRMHERTYGRPPPKAREATRTRAPSPRAQGRVRIVNGVRVEVPIAKGPAMASNAAAATRSPAPTLERYDVVAPPACPAFPGVSTKPTTPTPTIAATSRISSSTTTATDRSAASKTVVNAQPVAPAAQVPAKPPQGFLQWANCVVDSTDTRKHKFVAIDFVFQAGPYLEYSDVPESDHHYQMYPERLHYFNTAKEKAIAYVNDMLFTRREDGLAGFVRRWPSARRFVEALTAPRDDSSDASDGKKPNVTLTDQIPPVEHLADANNSSNEILLGSDSDSEVSVPTVASTPVITAAGQLIARFFDSAGIHIGDYKRVIDAPVTINTNICSCSDDFDPLKLVMAIEAQAKAMDAMSVGQPCEAECAEDGVYIDL